MKTKEALFEAITQFLEKGKGKSDGGWAEVREGDIQTIYDLFYGLLDLKYDLDVDQDRTINVQICDRNKHRFFLPGIMNKVPYSHMLTSREQYFQYIRSLASISEMANSELNRLVTYHNEFFEEFDEKSVDT